MPQETSPRKTALITGGAKRIGREIALTLARANYDIAITYRESESTAQATVAEIEAEGAKAYACIQSIAMTCQLRNLSFHAFLRASLVQFIRTGTPLLLAQYEASLQTHRKAA